jgi:hypothetical protein
MDRWDALRDFFVQNYRPDLPLCSRRYFEWQFRVRPGHDANIINAWDGDRLIGTFGYVPTPFHWGTSTVDGAWFYNWMVDPTYRHGLGFGLMRYAQERFPVLLSIAATEENARLVTRLGWAFHPRLPRYLAILDAPKASLLLMPGASSDELRPTNSLAANESQSTPLALTNEAQYQPDWRLYSSLAFGAVRSFDILRWRYLQHPAFSYSILTLGNATRPATCVYRIEESLGGATVRIARVVEFFHPDDREGKLSGISLVRALVESLRAQGCAYADFIGSGECGQTLLEAGWIREPEDHPLLAVRVRPIERDPFAYSLEYGAARDLPMPALPQVYATKADGDGDRPTTMAEILDN